MVEALAAKPWNYICSEGSATAKIELWFYSFVSALFVISVTKIKYNLFGFVC
jgi:hypothetical protein